VVVGIYFVLFCTTKNIEILSSLKYYHFAVLIISCALKNYSVVNATLQMRGLSIRQIGYIIAMVIYGIRKRYDENLTENFTSWMKDDLESVLEFASPIP